MLHMSTLQHKQVKSKRQHIKILWGRGTEESRAVDRLMEPGVEEKKTLFLKLKLSYHPVYNILEFYKVLVQVLSTTSKTELGI